MDKPFYCVIGTGTGVGKTLLSLLLMHYFFKAGRRPFYLKPFQTGCAHARDTDSDARLIYESLPQLAGSDPGDSIIHCLKSAKAPLFAARDQNIVIDTQEVLDRIRTRSARHDPLIVEAAGGIFVPVTETELILDLIEAAGARPLLVAQAGLGTINHTLLTLDALLRRKTPRPGLVFVSPPGDTTDPGMIRENMAAVTMFSDVPVAGLIPPIADFTRPEPGVFPIIERLVG
ncbi:dethiobiotin synthase [Desulfatiferula olefinivorans]